MKIKRSVAFIYVWSLGCMLIVLGGCKTPNLAEKQPDIPNGGRAVTVAMHPADNNKIVVASETGGLFRSLNGGDNWTHVSGATTFGYRDVMYHPANANVVIAAANADTRVVSGGGIYRSTNGGANWTKAVMNAPTTTCTNNMAAHSLSYDASNGRFWTGTDCGLFFSDDDGATWTFFSGATGLGNGSIRAVITPAANRMIVLTNNAVRVSTNGGSNWITPTTGLPGNRAAGQHNQIAVSPKNNQHIYFAFNLWEQDTGGNWVPKNALYYTQDFGANWSVIVKQNGWNRPPFVILSQSALAGGSNKIDLYYSNGGCQFRRREVVHGAIHGFNAWNNISIDHCDAADLGFGTDGKTPILLASDGGLHKTTDNGASWVMSGAGSKGYRALQITEVTGQKTSSDGLADLYFGTQDNDNWASANYGGSWTNRRCCEGFYLNVPRISLPAAATTHTGVSCAGCGNYKSGPVLTSQSGWNNPPRNAGTPALISPGSYIQTQFNADSSAQVLARTTNTGGSWTATATINQNIMNLPQVTGTAANPVIYLAVDKPGTTNGAPNIGLKRVSGILSSTYVQSDLSGFGNIGTFPTMFAWYEVFGVDPGNPNFILVPDISNDVVKKSTDGSITWTDDNNLTSLVTNSGEFKFHFGNDNRFSQISSFGFDPECGGHIMVGTQQAGIFQTFNSGSTWEKIPKSERIPYVSSFFFSKKGEVVISSYGRGLWRYRYKCPPPPVLRRPEYELREPLLWYLDQATPISRLVRDESCLNCGFYLLAGGVIRDVDVDTSSGKVREIFIDGGTFKGYGWSREPMQIPVNVNRGQGGRGILSDDKNLRELLEGKTDVRGIYLNGTLYSGVILHTKDIMPEDLPQPQEPGPRVSLNVSNNLGISPREAANLVIIGRGFDPQYPIEVLADGEPIKLNEKPRFNDKGTFRLSIPPVIGLGIGNHTLLIRQQTDKGIIEEVVDIRLTVQDFPEDRNGQE